MFIEQLISIIVAVMIQALKMLMICVNHCQEIHKEKHLNRLAKR